MYCKRALESVIRETMNHYPVVLLTGPRQVGKTTLLQSLFADTHDYVTLDDPFQFRQLQDDPLLFFQNNPGPLILDEIQYVPAAFRSIKYEVDRKKENGRYLLTGSQSFALMQHVSESLAGRIAIFNLHGLSLRERFQVDFGEPFVPTAEYVDRRKSSVKAYGDLWPLIHRGTMPKLCLQEEMNWERYYQMYLQTYLERDLRQLAQVGNERSFLAFMEALAARSGELLNYQSIAKDIGVSLDTVKRWTSILETSGIIYLLYPYANNHLKRALKTPKVYFLDTGLLAYLTRWPTADTLQKGALAGRFFETFVITEILKSFWNAGQTRPGLYYYRDRDQREIDLVIEDGQALYPIEIKLTANPQASMGRHFSVLDGIPGKTRKPGIVLCRYHQPAWLKADLLALPVDYI